VTAALTKQPLALGNASLSGYRIMWLFVVFDLPVLTKPERKRATKFRQSLLDEGFAMMQFSVYLRFTSGKEQIEALIRRIGRKVPQDGKVDVLSLTDQQYSAMTSFRGTSDKAKPRKPDQLALF
jgi:CRISPR-associated protein Cas2